MTIRLRYKKLDRKEKILFWIGCTIGLPVLIIAFAGVTILLGVGTAFNVLED